MSSSLPPRTPRDPLLDEFANALRRVRESKEGRRSLRGLSQDDGDDALEKALAWCWEHRAEYRTSLDSIGAWFAVALKWAAKGVRRDTAREAARRSRLTPEEAEQLSRGRRGHSIEESDGSKARRSRIDHDLERLLRRPKHGADCPRCWLCSYFEGFKPKAYAPPTWADAEIRAAVEATEREKIRIAGEKRRTAPRHARYVGDCTQSAQGWRNNRVSAESQSRPSSPLDPTGRPVRLYLNPAYSPRPSVSAIPEDHPC